MPEESYLDILCVPPDATRDEIERAYRKLSSLYHPDVNPEERKAWAGEKMRELNAAYEGAIKQVEKREFRKKAMEMRERKGHSPKSDAKEKPESSEKASTKSAAPADKQSAQSSSVSDKKQGLSEEEKRKREMDKAISKALKKTRDRDSGRTIIGDPKFGDMGEGAKEDFSFKNPAAAGAFRDHGFDGIDTMSFRGRNAFITDPPDPALLSSLLLLRDALNPSDSSKRSSSKGKISTYPVLAEWIPDVDKTLLKKAYYSLIEIVNTGDDIDIVLTARYYAALCQLFAGNYRQALNEFEYLSVEQNQMDRWGEIFFSRCLARLLLAAKTENPNQARIASEELSILIPLAPLLDDEIRRKRLEELVNCSRSLQEDLELEYINRKALGRKLKNDMKSIERYTQEGDISRAVITAENTFKNSEIAMVGRVYERMLSGRSIKLARNARANVELYRDMDLYSKELLKAEMSEDHLNIVSEIMSGEDMKERIDQLHNKVIYLSGRQMKNQIIEEIGMLKRFNPLIWRALFLITQKQEFFSQKLSESLFSKVIETMDLLTKAEKLDIPQAPPEEYEASSEDNDGN